MVVMSTTHAGVIRGFASRQCAHCRLPLPARPHRETDGEETLLFCCVGCVLVFRVIGSAGEGGRADWFLAKLGLAALLSGNIMMFQSLAYFGTLETLGSDVARTSSWIMFFCALAVFALLGVPMLRIAVRGLFRGRLTLETLIGFGALAAIGFSAAQTLRGGRSLYYDSGTMVLVFVTLGQYLDAESRRRALALLVPTMSRARRQARLFRNGAEVHIAPGSVRSGEIVHVRAGEEIPVDGTVAAGRGDVSEPLLTGEWRPRLVVAGDFVSAGSTAVDGGFTVCASGVAETLADRVQRFAVEARDRRAPIEAVVDRVITVFIPAVLLIAIGSCCLWGLGGEWERGFQAALAVLVVACPCALGIATPMATTIALSIAIGRGCLVRSGAVLETLSRIRVMAFDKTGTITLGRPQVIDYQACAGALTGADESLRLAAGVEHEVSHPFARALVAAVLARGESVPAAIDVRVTAGGGARGKVEDHRVEVGKLAWLAACGAELCSTIRFGRKRSQPCWPFVRWGCLATCCRGIVGMWWRASPKASVARISPVTCRQPTSPWACARCARRRGWSPWSGTASTTHRRSAPRMPASPSDPPQTWPRSRPTSLFYAKTFSRFPACSNCRAGHCASSGRISSGHSPTTRPRW
jgi:Cu2+-exporting ATPase